VKITAIRLDRMRLPLDPPFRAAWDPAPRRHFDATLVRVETDEGVTGYGSGDTMDGFEPFEPLFTGRDPLRIADHVRTIEAIGFHPPGWTPERRDFFLTDPLHIDPDGYLTVPDTPGLGARIDQAAVSRYAR
jgi:L-alanine-DL-glutamate epimerase-like enolase superfamily enzyme